MEYTDYLLAKFAILVGIVVVVNFVYALLTGKTLEQVRRDKSPARPSSTDPELTGQPGRQE